MVWFSGSLDQNARAWGSRLALADVRCCGDDWQSATEYDASANVNPYVLGGRIRVKGVGD